MRKQTRHPHARRVADLRRGFTLVESAISVLLVAGLIVVSMNTLGASVTSQHRTADRVQGRLLAADLMSEILQKPYTDPDGNAVFGPEPIEAIADRLAFDDVDDYHNYTESPPVDRHGAAMNDLSGWRRTVVVEYVFPVNLNQISAMDRGAKRITVTVHFQNVEVARLVAVRTSSGFSPTMVAPEAS